MALALLATRADDVTNQLVVFILFTTGAGIAFATWLRLRRQKDARRQSVLTDTSWVDAANVGPRAERALRRDDPDFTLARVEQYARELFRRVTEAGAARSLAPVHPWLSDGLFQRVEIELRLFGALFTAAVVETHELIEVSVVGFDRRASWQTLRLRLRFAVKDVTRRSRESDRMQEWTLLRRLTTKTPAHGLLDGCCPHCGAPLSLVASGRCAHCQAVINSGDHDWVLVEVADGVASLQGRTPPLDPHGVLSADAQLSVDTLEDRAAVAFWLWQEALATGQVDRLGVVAAPEVCEAARASRAPDALAGRLTFTSFRVQRLAREDVQRAWVAASWAELPAHGGEPRSHQVGFVLERAPDAVTPPLAGLSTARCSSCLGPLDQLGAGRCLYCGATFEQAWRLASILPWETYRASLAAAQGRRGESALAPLELLGQLPSEEREAVLRLLVAVARADSVVDATEAALLARYAERLGVPLPGEERLDPRAATEALHLRRDAAVAVVTVLFELAVANGSAPVAERKLIERAAQQLDVADAYPRLLAAALLRLRAGPPPVA